MKHLRTAATYLHVNFCMQTNKSASYKEIPAKQMH